MKTLNISCYEISEPDGCGVSNTHLVYASTAQVAYQIVKSLGSGWPRYVTPYSKQILIVESVEEYVEMKSAKQRQIAAAKLSASDRAALGIDANGDPTV